MSLVLGIEHQPAADPHFLPVVIGISVAAHVSCPRFQTSRGPACVLAANAGRGFHNNGNILSLADVSRQRHVPVHVLGQPRVTIGRFAAVCGVTNSNP